MTVVSAGVKEGDILAGKYRVDRVLGVGGMGVVVAAHHLQLDDRVAIKFLLPETLQNREAVARFAREARAAVKIKSDHVARVTDVGTLENGAPYMVMEYLEGDDLSGWVVARGALPVGLAVDFLLQACEAIAEAHTLGIVHRDLKPANLFVARTPGGGQRVKVLDFGISKLTSPGATSATRTSTLMGSPLYMSPEQMQSSRDVDARSDLWALGVILYELVAGASPFTAETMPELVLKVVGTQPQPLTSLRPDAPPGLEAVVMKCLEKDRTRRFQTVGELATALAPFGSARARISVDRISEVMTAAGMSTSSLELSAPAVSKVPGSGTTADFGGTSPGAGGGKSRPILLSAIVLVVLLGAGGVAAIGFRMTTRTAPESTVPATPTPEPSAAPAAFAPESASAAPVPAVAPADVAPVVAASASAAPPVAASARTRRTSGTRSGAGPKPKPSAAAAPAPVAKPSPTSLIDDRR